MPHAWPKYIAFCSAVISSVKLLLLYVFRALFVTGLSAFVRDKKDSNMYVFKSGRLEFMFTWFFKSQN